jgi:hypothetical protein
MCTNLRRSLKIPKICGVTSTIFRLMFKDGFYLIRSCKEKLFAEMRACSLKRVWEGGLSQVALQHAYIHVRMFVEKGQ